MEEEKAKGQKPTQQLVQQIYENERRPMENQQKKPCPHRPKDQGKVAMNREKDDKKKLHPHQRIEEWGTLKHSQDSLCGVLSDSENKEPTGRRTRHMSAFIRKTRSSSASNRIIQSHVAQRSRSCTETEGRVKNSCPSHVAAMAKTSIAHSSNAGILLSSENSRSFSAPILAPDKRVGWDGGGGGLTAAALFTVPHPKPERSVSPESNDSISEELNHFKPIVCSPRTPPKRLPDGRILEPVIIKSTPRNLSRCLHKATSYEAGPAILRKWQQIEMDRQHASTKLTSKSTATSPITEDVSPCWRSSGEKSKLSTPGKHMVRDHLVASVPQTTNSRMDKGKPLVGSKRKLMSDVSTTERDIPASCSENAAGWAALTQTRPGLHTCSEGEGAAKRSRDLAETQDHIHDPNGRTRVRAMLAKRKGRKRSQKTKHVEEAGRATMARPRRRARADGEHDVCRVYVRQTQQEKEDRELALKLQRQFSMECHAVDRRKTSPDTYPHQSWAPPGTAAGGNLRRSVRISQKKRPL
ncbi:hypothetical protein AGOR_G00027960 [Albula goreensis]|uniref:RING-type E3 ubiquitin transferase n=1 Tax=Albula goreensis TaxID=1534307 RepID=A0A8T3E2R7_9TELE|nr:hypothetical protein AGOR_G00027960 [Albula goreensis]